MTKALYNDVLSPFSLLFPFWIFPIYFCQLNLSHFDSTWDSEMWFSVISSTIAAIGGLILNRSVFRSKSITPKISINIYPSWNRLALINLTAIGLIVLIYNDLVTNPLGVVLLTFIMNPDLSRDAAWRWTGEGSSGLLSAFSYAVFAFAVQYLSDSGKWRKNVLFVLLLIAYPIVELLKASRSEAVMFLFSGLVGLHYRKFRLLNQLVSLTFKSVAVALVFLMCLYFSAEVFQVVRSSKSAGDMSEHLGIEFDAPPGVRSIIIEGYTYLATPFQNFSRYLSGSTNSDTRYLGVGLAKIVLPKIIFGQTADTQFQILDLDSYLVTFANTYPSITYMYAEGGIIGVIIETAIVSLVVGYFYENMIKHPSALSVSIYALVISRIWIWMFCSNSFAGNQYYLSMVICVLVSSLVNIKSTRSTC